MNCYEMSVKVTNPVGLHMRPLTKVEKVAKQHPNNIQLVYKGVSVDAKSMLSMLTLCAKRGANVRIRISKEGEYERIAQEIAREMNVDYS